VADDSVAVPNGRGRANPRVNPGRDKEQALLDKTQWETYEVRPGSLGKPLPNLDNVNKQRDPLLLLLIIKKLDAVNPSLNPSGIIQQADEKLRVSVDSI